MRNIFHEKLYTNFGVETSPRPFSKTLKGISWIKNLKFYTVCFYCMGSWRLSKYIETKPALKIKILPIPVN